MSFGYPAITTRSLGESVGVTDGTGRPGHPAGKRGGSAIGSGPVRPGQTIESTTGARGRVGTDRVGTIRPVGDGTIQTW